MIQYTTELQRLYRLKCQNCKKETAYLYKYDLAKDSMVRCDSCETSVGHNEATFAGAYGVYALGNIVAKSLELLNGWHDWFEDQSFPYEFDLHETEVDFNSVETKYAHHLGYVWHTKIGKPSDWLQNNLQRHVANCDQMQLGRVWLKICNTWLEDKIDIDLDNVIIDPADMDLDIDGVYLMPVRKKQ